MGTELKKEKYNGRWIISIKYDNGVKSYIPYGNIMEICSTKKEAVERVKKRIDEVNQRRKIEEESTKKPFRSFKHFYYKIKKSTHRYYGGANVTASIFLQKRKGLSKLGEIKWNTASYTGEETEVLKFLKRENHIPKYMFPNGYYGWNLAKEYNTKISKI